MALPLLLLDGTSAVSLPRQPVPQRDAERPSPTSAPCPTSERLADKRGPRGSEWPIPAAPGAVSATARPAGLPHRDPRWDARRAGHARRHLPGQCLAAAARPQRAAYEQQSRRPRATLPVAALFQSARRVSRGVDPALLPSKHDTASSATKPTSTRRSRASTSGASGRAGATCGTAPRSAPRPHGRRPWTRREAPARARPRMTAAARQGGAFDQRVRASARMAAGGGIDGVVRRSG